MLGVLSLTAFACGVRRLWWRRLGFVANRKRAEGEPPSKLKLGATGYGYLGPSTTPKLTAKRGQGLTQPERHTRRA